MSLYDFLSMMIHAIPVFGIKISNMVLKLSLNILY